MTRQDSLWVAASAVGGLILLAAGAHEQSDESWHPPWQWRVITLLVVCAAMLFRRTMPMLDLAIATPAVIVDVVLGVSLATAMVYTDSLYAATVYGPRRAGNRLLGVTVGLSLVALSAVVVVDGALSRGVVFGAIVAVWLVVPVLSGIGIREHRDRAEAERQRAEQVARLAEFDRRSAINAERARMARELHDVVANHLSAVALHSSAVLRLPDLDADGIRRAMSVIRENSVQGLAEMRRMIGLLREGEEETPATAPRLADVERLAERAPRPDLTVGFKIEGVLRELPAPVELAAYRIVQESLTNALKHAGPGRAEVLVEYLPDRVRITVESPLGRRMAKVPGTGSGLIGMRERVSILDGGFDAGPHGEFWRVHAELPATVEKENK